MSNISLSFKGETYTIPDSKAFEVGEAVEEIVSLTELTNWGDNPRFFKLSRAFGAMLRFAGCKVSDRDVHREMMREISELDEDTKQIMAMSAAESLVAVLMDGAPEMEGDQPEKKKASSKARTKQR